MDVDALAARLARGDRLARADAAGLLASRDLLAIGRLADAHRMRVAAPDVGVVEAAQTDADPRARVLVHGSTEGFADRLDALYEVRDAHDRGEVDVVVLRPYEPPGGQRLGDRLLGATSGWDDLKMVAVARLVCDRLPHVRAGGGDLDALGVALRFGADQVERPPDADPGAVARAVAAAARPRALAEFA